MYAKENDSKGVISSSHEKFASWLDRQGENIDMALSGKKYTNETKDTKLTVTPRTFWSEEDGFKFKVDADLDLRLPNFEDKYKLIISNYNEKKRDRSSYSRYNSESGDEEPDYGASLAFVRKIGDFDISFSPRLKIKNPISTYYTLTLDSHAEWGSHNFYTDIEFYADSQKGTGQIVTLRYRNNFAELWGHTITLEEEYQDADNYFRTLQGYSIHRSLMENMTLTQSVVLSSNNNGNYHLQTISTGPTLSHSLYPDKLHYSINYTLYFDKTYNFKGKSRASLAVDIIF